MVCTWMMESSETVKKIDAVGRDVPAYMLLNSSRKCNCVNKIFEKRFQVSRIFTHFA